MTQKLIIQYLKHKIKFKCTYRGKSLFKVEKVAGANSRSVWACVNLYVPHNLDLLEQFKRDYPTVKFDLIGEDRTTYTQFVDAWFDFFQRNYHVAPKFDGIQGAKIKKIMRYLEDVTGTPKDALQSWTALLQNWNRLPDFYRKKPDLKFIESQINNIIAELNELTRKTAKHTDADDFRKNF